MQARQAEGTCQSSHLALVSATQMHTFHTAMHPISRRLGQADDVAAHLLFIAGIQVVPVVLLARRTAGSNSNLLTLARCCLWLSTAL